MKRADKIVKGKYVVCMDQISTVIEDGALAILGSEIVGLGKEEDIEGQYEAEEVFDLGNSIVMPGMINTHTHASMTYFRGLADDLELDTWLNKHIWPAEAEFIDREFIKNASELAILEMICGGVTMFNDMYFFTGITGEIASTAGLRCMIGDGILDFPTPSAKTPAEAMAYTDELLKKFKNNPLVNIAMNPHSVYTCSEGTLKQVAEYALMRDLPIHIHLSETEKENIEHKKKTGLSPLQYLDQLGLINGKTILAHSIWLDDEDIRIIKERGAGISHNPISNMKLASGVMPLDKFGGLTVGLGTDGPASNNTLDLFSDMRQTALLHKSANADPGFLSAEQIVRMATIDSARVLGKDTEIGSLEVGKQADIISIDLNKAHLSPVYSVYSLIVYCANSSDVDNMMVAGKFLMRDREVLSLDSNNIFNKAREYSKKIKKFSV